MMKHGSLEAVHTYFFTKGEKNILKESNKGITLIALVVTIVVLLILAGITINFVLGENGIIKTAERAKNAYENSAEREKDELNKIMKEYDNILNGLDNNKTYPWEDWEGEEELTYEEIQIATEVKNLNESGMPPIVVYEVNVYTSSGEKVQENVINATTNDTQKTFDKVTLWRGGKITIKLKYCSTGYKCISNDTVEIFPGEQANILFIFDKNETQNSNIQTISIKTLIEYDEVEGWIYNGTYYNTGDRAQSWDEDTNVKGKIRVACDLSDRTLHTSFITNGEQEEAYLRFKIFMPQEIVTNVEVQTYDDNADIIPLRSENGYYYYDKIITDSTGSEVIDWKLIMNEDVYNQVTFDIVIVIESTDVLYNTDGTTYADWNN